MPNVVDIPKTLTNARAFRWRDDIVIPANFNEQIESFLALLEENKVDYLLVGGIALLQYTEGRNTEDIDLILAQTELSKLQGYQISDDNDMFATGLLGDLRVDILKAEHPFFEFVKTNYAATREFKAHELRCITPEGLVLLKLFALPSLYRQGNITRASIYESDLAALLHECEVEAGTLVDKLSPFLSASDHREVSKIILEIQQRQKRFQ